jgi:acyl-CoA hydrolase
MSEVQNVSLSQALKLEGADGTYLAQVRPEWLNGRGCFGGLVAGQLARAAERHVPSERSLRSALFTFVAPVAAGQVSIQARVLREGRALTQTEALVLQAGQLCAVMNASYGAARASQLRVDAAPAPVLDAPERLLRLPYVEGAFPACTQHFEYRWGSPRVPYSGSERGSVGGYVRHPRGGPSDAAGVLALADAWPPSLLPLMKRPAPASSVTWMIDILGALPPAGSESDAFYRYEADTVAAAEGYGSSEARLWAPNGQLLAASRQLMVEFS